MLQEFVSTMLVGHSLSVGLSSSEPAELAGLLQVEHGYIHSLEYVI